MPQGVRRPRDPIKRCEESMGGHRYLLERPDGTVYWLSASVLNSRLADRVAFHEEHPEMPVPADMTVGKWAHRGKVTILECEKTPRGYYQYRIRDNASGKEFFKGASN